MDSYISKLDFVFNLINNDIPDTYDDTLNSKFLDSIKNLMNKNEKLRVYLNDYVNKRIVFKDLASKEDEIQVFFLNLISLTYDLMKNDCLIVTQEFLDYLTMCSNSYNTIVEYAALNLTVKSFNTKNDKLLDFIKKNYLDNLSFFYDKSIFISKLYKDLIQIYVKNLYSCQKFNEIDLYFEVIKKSKSNLDVIFSFFDIIFKLYETFDGDNEIIRHLDGKLNDLIDNRLELNELVSNIKSINSIESYSFIWFKLNNNNEPLILHVENFIHKFRNYSFMFKFLAYLFKLAGLDDILKIYLLPINDFINGGGGGGGDLKEKESCLNHCLLTSFLISQYLTLNSFNLSNVNAILKNFSLNIRIKRNLLKLLSNVLLREEDKNGKYYHLYSILNDYSTTMMSNSDDEDLLNIFLIYLNKSTKENENDELIEIELFDYSSQIKDKKKILNILYNLNNYNFSFKLISNDNYSLINEIYKSIVSQDVDENDENDDELKECLLKVFRKYYKILINSPLSRSAFSEDWILNTKFYLKSNISERNELIEIVNQLFRYYLDEHDENMLKKCISYYSFILTSISNDYYNQDTFDIEIKLLNFINKELSCERKELFQSLSPNLMKLIQNDYFYSKNSKYNYIKNIRLISANILLKMNENDELVRNVKLLCESYCDEYSNDDDDMNLLNDIISSYEFNMNDNKISDCY